MTSVPAVPLQDAAGARAADVAAVERGATWADLMNRAAAGLARGVVRYAGGAYGLRVAIMVGHGNNGGDGWAAALHLREMGAMPWVVAVTGTSAELSPEATEFRRQWLESGGRTGEGLAAANDALAQADVVVDALLGTGATGEPRGEIAEACKLLAAAEVATIACDIPTGVDADTGAAAALAVHADATVTFGALKRGLLLTPGRDHAGHVTVSGLGPHWRADSSWNALTASGAAPRRFPLGADKRARGVVLVVGGAVGTAGAAAMAAGGAVRAGAGLVTVATPETVREEVAAHDPAIMTKGLLAADGGLAADAQDELDMMVDRADVVVAGPGLGTSDGVRHVVAALRARAPRLVLDADALNVHRDDPAALADHPGDLVLTPHDRELARIHPDRADAVARRSASVPELARRLNATVLAKGPSTMIAAPDGRVWLTPTGGPGLGSGGTGDVLAGVVAAAIAMADDVPLAVAQAAWWHGLAGDLAAHSAAGRGTAAAVLDRLPEALHVAATHAATDPTFPFELR
ncbi:MAG: NAD(P)H-hydrate dehydratase [Nitriliruptorales bacterium]|nr:NAD(P)H-hydrate dehydratase [Nitriliruptorales bacterium]